MRDGRCNKKMLLIVNLAYHNSYSLIIKTMTQTIPHMFYHKRQ